QPVLLPHRDIQDVFGPEPVRVVPRRRRRALGRRRCGRDRSRGRRRELRDRGRLRVSRRSDQGGEVQCRDGCARAHFFSASTWAGSARGSKRSLAARSPYSWIRFSISVLRSPVKGSSSRMASLQLFARYLSSSSTLIPTSFAFFCPHEPALASQ